MNITRKRVINPQRYLYALHPGDKFYIAVPLEVEDYPCLQSYVYRYFYYGSGAE